MGMSLSISTQITIGFQIGNDKEQPAVGWSLLHMKQDLGSDLALTCSGILAVQCVHLSHHWWWPWLSVPFCPRACPGWCPARVILRALGNLFPRGFDQWKASTRIWGRRRGKWKCDLPSCSFWKVIVGNSGIFITIPSPANRRTSSLEFQLLPDTTVPRLPFPPGDLSLGSGDTTPSCYHSNVRGHNGILMLFQILLQFPLPPLHSLLIHSFTEFSLLKELGNFLTGLCEIHIRRFCIDSLMGGKCLDQTQHLVPKPDSIVPLTLHPPLWRVSSQL